MHKMMGLFMMGNQEGYVLVVQAAVQIGVAIEQEVSDKVLNLVSWAFS